MLQSSPRASPTVEKLVGAVSPSIRPASFAATALEQRIVVIPQRAPAIPTRAVRSPAAFSSDVGRGSRRAPAIISKTSMAACSRITVQPRSGRTRTCGKRLNVQLTKHPPIARGGRGHPGRLAKLRRDTSWSGKSILRRCPASRKNHRRREISSRIVSRFRNFVCFSGIEGRAGQTELYQGQQMNVFGLQNLHDGLPFGFREERQTLLKKRGPLWLGNQEDFCAR